MTEDDVDRAVEIARRATAHNYGQTVFDVETSAGSILDGDVTSVEIMMSSWPRAEEAIKALKRAGFRAEHSDRSGADWVLVTQ